MGDCKGRELECLEAKPLHPLYHPIPTNLSLKEGSLVQINHYSLSGTRHREVTPSFWSVLIQGKSVYLTAHFEQKIDIRVRRSRIFFGG